MLNQNNFEDLKYQRPRKALKNLSVIRSVILMWDQVIEQKRDVSPFCPGENKKLSGTEYTESDKSDIQKAKTKEHPPVHPKDQTAPYQGNQVCSIGWPSGL